MNQGRIWCVVHPTVGLPLFLGSVALTSLAVHTAVMTHTNWMSNYWQGHSKVKVNGAAETSSTTQAGPGFAMTVTPMTGAVAGQAASFVITVSPTPQAATTVPAVNTRPVHAPPIHTASAG
jgi:light-harvesting protein B-800-850 alpha chain